MLKLQRLLIKNGRVIFQKSKYFLALLGLFLYTLVIYSAASNTSVLLPTSDVPIHLYSNQTQDDLKKTFISAILQAKTSITCIIYALTDQDILHALNTKSEEGIRIFIIADAVASQNATFQLNPKIVFRPVRHKGLMHNKLLVIDQRQAWLGSSNFTRDSLLLHANLVLAIDSEEVAHSIEIKAQQLFEHHSRKITPICLQAKQEIFELFFLPDSHHTLYKVQKLLQGASKSVKVAMFTFTHHGLIQTLIDLHKKGIKVEIVLDRDSSQKTSRIAFQRFKQENMDVSVSNRPGLLHEKIAIIDDTILIGGSTNWTKAGFTTNDEHLFILSNLTQDHAEKLRHFWQTTKREAVSIL